MKKTASMLIAAAVVTSVGLSTVNEAAAHHRHHGPNFGFSINLGNPGFFTPPGWHPPCVVRWVRVWSPRRGRYVRRKRCI